MGLDHENRCNDFPRALLLPGLRPPTGWNSHRLQSEEIFGPCSLGRKKKIHPVSKAASSGGSLSSEQRRGKNEPPESGFFDLQNQEQVREKGKWDRRDLSTRCVWGAQVES